MDDYKTLNYVLGRETFLFFTLCYIEKVVVLFDKFALQRQRAVTKEKMSACEGADEGVEGGVQSSLIEF